MIEYTIELAALLSLVIGFAFIVIFNKRLYWVAEEADDDIFTFAVMLFLARLFSVVFIGGAAFVAQYLGIFLYLFIRDIIF